LQDIEFPTTGDVTPIDYKIIPGDQLILKVFTLDESMKTLFSMYIEDNKPIATGSSSSANQTSMNTNSNSTYGGRDMPNNVLNVSSDGMINIPYIGLLNVKDLTVLEAKTKIANSFSAFSPNVTVDIALRNRYFFVLGAAGSRSIQMNNLRMTIYQALALSGNIEIYGDRKNVRILRQTAEGTEFKTFDLRSKDILNSEYYYIQPNDVIYMPQVQRRFFGAVTSFTGVFGLISSFIGIGVLVIKLTR